MALSRAILITGGESQYVSLLEGLLRSLDAPGRPDNLDIGLLDLGLTDEQSAGFKQRGISVVVPDWDVDLSLFHQPPPGFYKGMTARPHLPKYFPGYDTYLWMDADTWLQDWAGIRLYLSSAQSRGLAATPEVDRAYLPVYGNISVISWRHNIITRCFNAQFANQLSLFPTVNCGVFAARGDAPHWARWAGILADIFKRNKEAFFFAEQTAFNAMIRQGDMPIAFLPSTCNWMCNRALPMCSDDGVELLEPHPPFQRLNVLHLTADTKNGVWALPTRNGEHVRSLRFGGHDRAQAGPDVVIPKV